MMMVPALSAPARMPPSMATKKMTALRRQTPGTKQLTTSGRRGTCPAPAAARSLCVQCAAYCGGMLMLQCSITCRSSLLCRAITRERALLAVVGLLSSMHDTEGLIAR